MIEVYTLPPEPIKVINEYLNLQLGGKSVPCPYYMNVRKDRMGLTALLGKGNPGEIEREVKVWAKLRGFDLEAASISQIRDFMRGKGIGIDCSGFIANVLSYWLFITTSKKLVKYMKFQ
jgi:hypothetical protein